MYNSERDFISRTIFRTEVRSFAIPKPCNNESEREKKLKRDAGEHSDTQTSIRIYNMTELIQILDVHRLYDYF